MHWPNLFNHPPESAQPLFDEAFFRRLERLSFRTAPSLRGTRWGERRSHNLRPALDFSDHRPYSTGDDLRHIDWNAYARHEELFVKLGEAAQSINLHILLDNSRSMAWSPGRQPGGQSSSKWDAARRLTGAMAYLGLAGGEWVEIAPFSQTLGAGIGPTAGKRRIIPILKYLSDLAPSSERTGTTGGLTHSLTTYARTHPAGGLLVLISDLLDPAGPTSPKGKAGEELAGSLGHLSPPHWQVLVIHLLTEEEIGPTQEGDFDLQDSETGESLPFHLDSHTLTQYRLRARSWCAAMQSACARQGATYARVLAEWPLEQAVVPFLRQRGVIR